MQRKKTLFFLVFFVIFIFGCSPKVTEITAPPDTISLDEVTKINLKMLDLDKLSKSDINELDGIRLKENTVGYELEYRYPDKPIKIKIIKFVSKNELTNFWLDWLTVHNLDQQKNEQSVKFELQNKYAVYAWQKGQWFTYIGVPSEPLRDKVKDIISNHYLNLAKREN
ncbi:MAG: hypothetical protein PWQ67_1833 [Clostridia bacterium]|jgi:hypothetical protein|nr:hypothetical protein [Clostridia bacterium]MDN5323379.1 hypothetical protein [Clostridia bacterium]